VFNDSMFRIRIINKYVSDVFSALRLATFVIFQHARYLSARRNVPSRAFLFGNFVLFPPLFGYSFFRFSYVFNKHSRPARLADNFVFVTPRGNTESIKKKKNTTKLIRTPTVSLVWLHFDRRRYDHFRVRTATERYCTAF